jgi:hypothetical protein
MCILQKTLPYTNKTRQRLSRYPTIYIICYWARVSYLSFPFTGKYDNKGRPLVYQFDDHDGLYPEYCLRNVNEVTSAHICEWTTNADDVQRLITKWQTKYDEYRAEMIKTYEENLQAHENNSN